MNRFSLSTNLLCLMIFSVLSSAQAASNPSFVAWGTVPSVTSPMTAGQAYAYQYTVQNTYFPGSLPITPTAVSTVGGSAPVISDDTCTSGVAQGSVCHFTATITPTSSDVSLGGIQATISLSYPARYSTSPVSINASVVNPIVYSPNLTVVGYYWDGTPYVYHSANGTSWTQDTVSIFYPNYVVNNGDLTYVLGGSGDGGGSTTTPLYYSILPGSWTAEATLDGGAVPSTKNEELSFSGSQFFAVMYNYDASSNQLWSSPDGNAWSTVSISMSGYPSLMAAGESNGIPESVLLTAGSDFHEYDSLNAWAESSSFTIPEVQNLNDMAYGKNSSNADTWVIVGSQLFTSNPISWVAAGNDLTTWTKSTTGLSSILHGLMGVTYGAPNGGSAEFVTIDDAWQIYTSPDGSTWTAKGSAISNSGSSRRIRYIDALQLFIALGDQGQIFTSKDLSTWSPSTGTSTDATFYDAAGSNPHTFLGLIR